MKHYVRGPVAVGEASQYLCSCSWQSTARKDPEQARLESCRHLATVLRFGSVTIGGDAYLVPRGDR